MNPTMRREVFRVIDANFNRSREGLRVCEDIMRFVANSESLIRKLKKVRHGVSGVLKKYPGKFIGDRDTPGDVGKVPRTAIELKRLDTRDIFEANIERVKESLRVLEEFFKLIDMGSSAKLSALRFEVYDIEKRAAKNIAALR